MNSRIFLSIQLQNSRNVIRASYNRNQPLESPGSFTSRQSPLMLDDDIIEHPFDSHKLLQREGDISVDLSQYATGETMKEARQEKTTLEIGGFQHRVTQNDSSFFESNKYASQTNISMTSSFMSNSIMSKTAFAKNRRNMKIDGYPQLTSLGFDSNCFVKEKEITNDLKSYAETLLDLAKVLKLKLNEAKNIDERNSFKLHGMSKLSDLSSKEMQLGSIRTKLREIHNITNFG